MWRTSEIRGRSPVFGAARRGGTRRSLGLEAGTDAALPPADLEGISMRKLTIVAGLVLTGASACGRSGTGGPPHALGQTSFESPPPGHPAGSAPAGGGARA